MHDAVFLFLVTKGKDACLAALSRLYFAGIFVVKGDKYGFLSLNFNSDSLDFFGQEWVL